jgi:ketosteroid isomerase-like protein
MNKLHASWRFGAFSLCLRCCGLAALVLLWCGCAAKPPAAADRSTTEQIEVKNRLAEIFDAAETKDLSRLDTYHWYGPHFTKFASGIGKRMDAETAREGEHRGLEAIADMKLRAHDLKIDVFDTTAVATFLATASLQTGAGTVTKRERGTLVFVKHDGSWKIVHEHFSAAD